MKEKISSDKHPIIGFLLFGPTSIVTLLFLGTIMDILDSEHFIPINILLLITLIFWGFSILVWTKTYYELTDFHIIARFGYLYFRKIKLTDIKSFDQIKFGNRTIGLSVNCLSIKIKTGYDLNISPKDPDGFIKKIEKRIKTIANNGEHP